MSKKHFEKQICVGNTKIILTRLHSSRMRTARFSGRFSCTHAPLPHTFPSATPLPYMPPLFAAHPLPLPCIPPIATHVPPLWTEGMTHACENSSFPQLLLHVVMMCVRSCKSLNSLQDAMLITFCNAITKTDWEIQDKVYSGKSSSNQYQKVIKRIEAWKHYKILTS